MNTYKILSKQYWSSGKFSLVPIRMQDRYDIMKWRNEQIYHLRQDKPLTKEDQDKYFNETVAKLFDQEKPNQILFSFLEDKKCIGYGGLVHINWVDRNAEVSFLIDTKLEKYKFEHYWSDYLILIEKIAFDELYFHKIYIYAFDVRPHLYPTLEQNSFFLDARLRDHCYIDDQFRDVVIYSKLKSI